MKFVLILIIVGFNDAGKTMIELSTKFDSEVQCKAAGEVFKGNNNLRNYNWKEYDCIAVSN